MANTFLKLKLNLRLKLFKTLGLQKGITKSSKTKQKLYERFRKKRTLQNEQKYKNYRNLFKASKKTKENILNQKNN